MLVFWFLIIGAILVLMAFAGPLVQRLPVSAAIIYLALGWALGPAGVGLLAIDPAQHGAVVEVVAEIAVLVSLFAVGLKLRVPLERRTWRVPLRLAWWGMLASIALTAFIAWLLLDLPWPLALLLGAVLAPTDPVLASDVQIRAPDDRDAVRFSLTAEGAINDGMAFPMVMLALGLLNAHALGVFGARWLLVDFIWAVAGGMGVGFACGRLVRAIVLGLRRSGRSLEFEEFLVLGVIGLVYGVALLTHTYGFLAVFAAALALNRADRGSRAEELLASRLLTFTGQAERLCEVAVVLLAGALLAYVEWSVQLLGFAAVMLLVVRPVAVFVALPGRLLPAAQRRLVAWFGIRGVGSIYYVAYAGTHGVDATSGQNLLGIAVATIAASIIAHGVSAGPLMQWHERRRDRPPRA
jgi:NhaP-type Na+/H+ or K+/H+ antiporter